MYVSKYCLDTALDRLRKQRRLLSHDNQRPGPDMNQGPSE
jgi:hypothetical protein